MTVAGVFPGARAHGPATRDATGRKDDGFGGESVEITVNTGVGDATRDTVTFLQEASNGVFHENVNAFVDASFLQGSNDFQTRSVANVGEAREGVAAKVSLIDEVLWGAVKHSAPLFEFTNTVRGFFGVEFCHAPVGKPLAALHRVVEVHFPTVSRVGVLERSSASTFSHDGVCFSKQGLGDDGGLGAASSRFNGCAETCSTRTDDDDIVFVFRNVFAHRLTSHHEEHHIAQAAIGHGQHPKVAKEYENQRGPEPKPVRTVEDADFAKQHASDSTDAGGPAVQHASGEVPQGVAGGDIHREQEGFNPHHKGPDGYAVTVVACGMEMHGVGDVPPLDDENDHGGVKEVAVKVVEDEQALLALVADCFVDVRFVHPAGGGAGEERAVIDASHVVAGAPEAKGDPKDEDGGVDPFGMVPFVQTKQAPLENVR